MTFIQNTADLVKVTKHFGESYATAFECMTTENTHRLRLPWLPPSSAWSPRWRIAWRQRRRGASGTWRTCCQSSWGRWRSGGRRGRSKVTDTPAKWTTWMQLKGVFSGVIVALNIKTGVSGQVMEIKGRKLILNVPDCSENQQSYKQRDMPIEGGVKFLDDKFVSNYCSAT